MVSNSSHHSIVDEAIMAQMRALAPDSQWLLDLYDQFVTQTQEQLVKLKHAFETSDKEASLFLLHAMKSSARQVGATQFAQQLEGFEAYLELEKESPSLQSYLELEVQFARFSETIKVVLKQEKGTA